MASSWSDAVQILRKTFSSRFYKKYTTGRNAPKVANLKFARSYERASCHACDSCPPLSQFLRMKRRRFDLIYMAENCASDRAFSVDCWARNSGKKLRTPSDCHPVRFTSLLPACCACVSPLDMAHKKSFPAFFGKRLPSRAKWDDEWTLAWCTDLGKNTSKRRFSRFIWTKIVV